MCVRSRFQIEFLDVCAIPLIFYGIQHYLLLLYCWFALFDSSDYYWITHWCINWILI